MGGRWKDNGREKYKGRDGDGGEREGDSRKRERDTLEKGGGARERDHIAMTSDENLQHFLNNFSRP